jgi:hypothetical protein
MAWTQRSSRKRSWLTSSTAPAKRWSQPSSHIAASRSRWLVGSSSSSRSGSRNSARASATRIRQPPENSPTGRACAAASKPRPASTVAARAGALSAPMARRRSWTSPRRAASGPRSSSASSAARSASASSTVSSRLSGPAGASCATWPSRARAAKRISPPSGAIWPETARSRVDLPAPLRPTSPTRRPGSTARSASSRSARPAMRRVRLRIATRSWGCSTTGAGVDQRPPT